MMTTEDYSFDDILIDTLREATNQGDTVTLISRSLPFGTPRWELVDKDDVSIIGSLDKDLLFKTAEKVKVKVVEGKIEC